MRICFFLSDYTKVGGIERVTTTLASRLCKISGLSVEIISMFKGKDMPNYKLPSEIKVSYLVSKKHGLKPHSFKRIISLLSNLSAVRDFFKKHEYDLVIGQSFPMALTLFLSGIPKKHIIAVEHVYSGYYGDTIQRIRDYVYKRVREVVVLTHADKMFFQSRIPQQTISVIPNPVCKPDGLPSNLENKAIITVGRLEYQKGYDNLINAFSKIHAKYPDWTLNIFGQGSLRKNLQELIKKLNLSSVVRLCGVTNDIDSKFKESSIFVMSSRFEGFGMVLVEALSNGVPCVSYDCPNGPADIIVDGFNGFLVPDQDSEALIKAIETLIENPDMRKEFGKNGMSSIKQYSENTVAEMWCDVFNKNTD